MENYLGTAACWPEALGVPDAAVWRVLRKEGVQLRRQRAIANERLTLNRAGQVVLTLKTLHRDRTTHMVMSPLELLQRLAALVSRPRFHQRGSSLVKPRHVIN